ncbi:head-tail adaptor protein [Staphylococcus epidermidis]|nr:head-tail adaptor protein [Staphylococcus epidermidis]MBM6213889.1 head-tail adaptor protein [Staphylococcus epidermidis]MBM6216196.1 head-tail adaptor protein [Staphylococcus epidermidis]
MNLNELDYRVAFYSVSNNGPEAGAGNWEEVFSCFAGLYEPTQKDVQLGNLETSKRSVTINIRNAQPDFLPTVNHVFEIKNGMYAGLTFDIKNVEPAKTPNYIKVVGEES